MFPTTKPVKLGLTSEVRKTRLRKHMKHFQTTGDTTFKDNDHYIMVISEHFKNWQKNCIAEDLTKYYSEEEQLQYFAQKFT
jgi:hypothetical protein